jgi:putative membrane protein
MAGVAVIALMGSPALAQNQDPSAAQQQQQTIAGAAKQQLAQEDMDFVKKAAGDGMAEVKLGQLAQTNAESDQVKQFGQRMVDDHTEAGDQLKSIAQQKSIDLPQQPPEDAQKAYDELQKKKGHEFDQAYMEGMVKDHKKAVELFQNEAKSGKDQDLQKFAQETLPTLQQHLDLAQKTQEQVSASAAPGQAQQQANATSTDQPRAATAAATAQATTDAGNKPPTTAAETTKMANETAANPPAAAATGSAPQQAANPPAATEKPVTTAEKPMIAKPNADQQQAAVQPTATQVKAEDVIGSKVVNNKGDKVGKIEDLVVDNNKVQYAVVSVGGFLGIGAKHVVVPIDQLKLGKDQAYLISAQTEDELKQMPEYKEGTYKSEKQG